MNDKAKRAALSRLCALARMMEAARLAELAQANAARAASQAAIDRLAEPVPGADLGLVTDAAVRLAHGRWSDAQRSRIQTVLDRQTAVCEQARQTAARAFGRSQALTGLQASADRTAWLALRKKQRQDAG